MSRTLNGRCTGQAAQIERADNAEEFRKNAFSWRWSTAIKALRELDPGFDTWYDSYPDEMPKGEFLPLMEERISLLHASTVARTSDAL